MFQLGIRAFRLASGEREDAVRVAPQYVLSHVTLLGHLQSAVGTLELGALPALVLAVSP